MSGAPTLQPELIAGYPPTPTAGTDAGLIVSVVIATFRRPHTLQVTLESLAWQDIDTAGSELIVVDNDPKRSAEAVVARWNAPAGWTVRYLTEPAPGKIPALNTGIASATRSLICFLDDDIVLFPQALRAYRQALRERPDVAYFGGPYVPVCLDGGVPAGWELTGRHRIYLAWPSHDLGQTNRLYGAGETPLGGNRIIRREVFERGIRFASQFSAHGLRWCPADDMEFGERLRLMGMRFVYVADAKALHLTERALFAMRKLWTRYLAYGRYQILAESVRHGPSTWARHRHVLRDLASDAAAACGHRLRGDVGGARYHWLEVARQLGMLRQIQLSKSRAR